jgi:hypothetical protein
MSGRKPSQKTDRPDRRLNRMAVPRGDDHRRPKTPGGTGAKACGTCDNRPDATRYLGRPRSRGLRPLDRRRSEPRLDSRRRPPSPLRIARVSERPDRPGRPCRRLSGLDPRQSQEPGRPTRRPGLDERREGPMSLDPAEPALGAQEARHAPPPPHVAVTPAGHAQRRLDRVGRRQRPPQRPRQPPAIRPAQLRTSRTAMGRFGSGPHSPATVACGLFAPLRRITGLLLLRRAFAR